MLDELNEPLGIGRSAAAPLSHGRAAGLATLAAFAVAAAFAGGFSALSRTAPQVGGALVADERPGPLAERRLPPRREAADPALPLPPPAPPPQAAAVKDAGSDAGSDAAKPLAKVAGQPQPLIIDVQQALAALKAGGVADPAR